MEEKKLIFVCGLHRSGTSLLTRLIGRHPRVSAMRNTGVPEDEGQHLQSVFPPAKDFGGAGVFCLHPEARLDEKSPLVTEESRERLIREWGSHWDLKKSHLLEKSPPNLVRTRFLQALFPVSSLFVVITRHPVPVAFSTLRMRRRLPEVTFSRLLRNWTAGHETFLRDRRHLRRVMVIAYERLVAKPQESMDEIFSFLGLSGEVLLDDVDPERGRKYDRVWARGGGPRAVRRLYLAARHERSARRFGYSLLPSFRWPGGRRGETSPWRFP